MSGAEPNESDAPPRRPSDEKNFRSSYYTKVGFRGVEERRSIETFLRPVDIAKIRLFLKSYTLPEMHRVRVWKLLLGVEMPFGELSDEAKALRTLNCEQLRRSVTVLCKPAAAAAAAAAADEPPVAERIAQMVIMERGDLRRPISEQFNSADQQDVAKLATCLTAICPLGFEDNFYMVKGFARLIDEHRPQFPQIKEEVLHLVQKEDAPLEQHLRRFRLEPAIRTLLARCYADTFDISLIIKVWDKVLGGHFRQVMPKVTAAFLLANRAPLLLADEQTQLDDKLMEPFSSDLNDLILDHI